MQADSDRLLDLVFSCAATCVPLWWGGWPPQRHLHRRRLRGHVPPIIENRTCIYHFLPPFPQYFGLPTQYFCQVYASGHLQKVSVQIETPFCILWGGLHKNPSPEHHGAALSFQSRWQKAIRCHAVPLVAGQILGMGCNAVHMCTCTTSYMYITTRAASGTPRLSRRRTVKLK